MAPGLARERRHSVVLFGLLTAAGWGLSAVAATTAARRAGTYVAVLISQGLGVVVLVVLAGIIHPSFAAVAGHLAGLTGAGVLGLGGYLTYYRALETGGSVGLVSAISATYGGVATVLAVLLLHERLGPASAAGIGLAVAGVALALARGPGTAEAAPLAVGEPLVGVAPGPAVRRGVSRVAIPLALASALCYGFGGFLLGYSAGQTGWLTAPLVAHGTSVTMLLAALPFFGRPKEPGVARSGLGWAAVAGLTDVAGLLAFSRGGAVGQVAVTAAVSSVYPAVPLVAGLALFGERLAVRQVGGIGCIVAGLVLIGLG